MEFEQRMLRKNTFFSSVMVCIVLYICHAFIGNYSWVSACLLYFTSRKFIFTFWSVNFAHSMKASSSQNNFHLISGRNNGKGQETSRKNFLQTFWTSLVSWAKVQACCCLFISGLAKEPPNVKHDWLTW